MKKMVLCFVVMIAAALSAHADRGDEVTLVMVPREDGAVRVGMDVASRYPTLLISYKVVGDQVSLHGWNGSEWVNINYDNFKTGAFFRTAPDSALIVEKAGASVPNALIPSEDWCPAVYKISTTDVRPLLHLTGQYYDFKHKDWAWFSKNYNLSTDAINPEGLNEAWYHKSLGGHLKKSPAAGDDLMYWSAVRHPQTIVIEDPVDAPAAETNVVEAVEQPEMEATEDPMENPLTNDAPAAVVLGPSEAAE